MEDDYFPITPQVYQSLYDSNFTFCLFIVTFTLAEMTVISYLIAAINRYSFARLSFFFLLKLISQKKNSACRVTEKQESANSSVLKILYSCLVYRHFLY